MGRVAGVTAAETRERLLSAAADVFAERGYDGTRVADIAALAGVSNGALYAHFGSKADLLVGALRVHGRRVLAEALAAGPDRPVTDLLLEIGGWLPQRRDARGYLIVEALVAARRDGAVAGPMRDYVRERADKISSLVMTAQANGEIGRELAPDALAHFCLLLAMGSALITSDLHAVGEGEWAALLARVVAGLAPSEVNDDNGGDKSVKVRIDSGRCQGHGRCYDLAPDLFGDDDEGYGRVLGDGVVPPAREQTARLAALNCPERAVEVLEEE